jgi:hypothetical protein
MKGHLENLFAAGGQTQKQASGTVITKNGCIVLLWTQPALRPCDICQRYNDAGKLREGILRNNLINVRESRLGSNQDWIAYGPPFLNF